MTECGCKVEPKVSLYRHRGAINIGTKIVYCPKHAAADAMYEALLDADYAVWYMANHGLEGDLIDWEERFEKLTAALALAEGDSND